MENQKMEGHTVHNPEAGWGNVALMSLKQMDTELFLQQETGLPELRKSMLESATKAVP